MIPDGFDAQPTHHGTPMTYKGSGVTWEGDYELHTIRYACDCGFTCEIHTSEMDGGPEMVRRRQDQP